jgi:hypothetical protein
VDRLATLEACPHVSPHVHPVLLHPLKPLGQQCQLVLPMNVELLIWQRHQRGQGEHPGGCVSVRFSFLATDVGKTMRVS